MIHQTDEVLLPTILAVGSATAIARAPEPLGQKRSATGPGPNEVPLLNSVDDYVSRGGGGAAGKHHRVQSSTLCTRARTFHRNIIA